MASQEFYKQRAIQFQEEANQLSKVIGKYSIGRLLVAAIIIVLIYFGFAEPFYFSGAPLLLFLFVYLVQSQVKLERERELVLYKVKLNQAETAACNYDFKSFPGGKRFIDPHHPYSYDLDVFGEGSLFQYLNRCATRLGENKLAEDLTKLKYDKHSIQLRQEAIRELGSRIDFRQQCWAIGKQIHDKDFDLALLWFWLKQPAIVHGNKLLLILRWVLPSVTLLSLVLMMFISGLQGIFISLFLLQLGLCSRYNKSITKLQNELSIFRIILENYSRVFKLMKEESFHSSFLKQHHEIACDATGHVKKVSSLINAIESRMNLIARVFGNGIFMYDLHSVNNLEEWKLEHANALPRWIESLSEWDSLLSFATLHYNHPHYAFADITESLSITGKDVGHPLIDEKIRVTNSFELGNPSKVMLITGANMAGKSTFLRTVGVNYLLASNGAPVCAVSWSSPCVELRTGMRTSDSLQEHQSYFFAELNRLQSIIEDLRQGKPIIILLDEILKGTNSTDKQTGSRELIKQLIQQRALVLLATHDIALGDMEHQYPGQIINTCFEGKIEEDELTFDYKLHTGLAQKANATFLMRKMGIIPLQE